MNKKNLSYREAIIYNEFIDILIKKFLPVESLDVYRGNCTKTGEPGLLFELNTYNGLTDNQAKQIFYEFINKYKSCGIDYNKPESTSALEDALREKSETFLSINPCVPLKKVKLPTNNFDKKESKKKTYLMIDRNTNYYKIGKSETPKFREKTLQSEKPTIELIHVINKDIEKVLHYKFAHKRIRGEWFSLNQKDVDSIKTITG